MPGALKHVKLRSMSQHQVAYAKPGPHSSHLVGGLRPVNWVLSCCQTRHKVSHACTTPDVHLHRAVLHRAVDRELALPLPQTLFGDLPGSSEVPDLQVQVKEPT